MKLPKINLKKAGRILKSFAFGFLNGNPITALFTPSIQEVTEDMKDADLDENGKVGKLKMNNVNVYYITNLIGTLIGVSSTVFVSIWGLKNGLTPEQIDWILNNIQKNIH